MRGTAGGRRARGPLGRPGAGKPPPQSRWGAGGCGHPQAWRRGRPVSLRLWATPAGFAERGLRLGVPAAAQSEADPGRKGSLRGTRGESLLTPGRRLSAPPHQLSRPCRLYKEAGRGTVHILPSHSAHIDRTAVCGGYSPAPDEPAAYIPAPLPCTSAALPCTPAPCLPGLHPCHPVLLACPLPCTTDSLSCSLPPCSVLLPLPCTPAALSCISVPLPYSPAPCPTPLPLAMHP